MNLLFFSHYFPPEGNAPASRLFENARRWVAMGHSVTVVTGVPNVPDGVVYPGYENRWRQWETVEGIQVLRVKTYIAPNKGFGRRILNYLSYMISCLQALWGTRGTQLVIATSPQFFCAVGGAMVAAMKGVPFVLEVRDLWPDSIIAVGAMKSRPVIHLLQTLEHFLYRRADRIVALTHSFKRILIEKGVPVNKIEVITNGVDSRTFSPSPPDRAVMPCDPEAFVVSYIGTLGMAHALDKVLASADRLRDYRGIQFLLVGSGAEKARLLTLKQEMGLDNVFFVDRQPKAKMPAYYAASNVCLVPLRKTPLFETVIPSKMFEIMAMERPILMSVNGEARQILEAAGAGLYTEPENVDMLTEAILKLYHHPEQCRQMGIHGRQFIETHYQRHTLAQTYIEAMEALINPSP